MDIDPIDQFIDIKKRNKKIKITAITLLVFSFLFAYFYLIISVSRGNEEYLQSPIMIICFLIILVTSIYIGFLRSSNSINETDMKNEETTNDFLESFKNMNEINK